MSSLLKATWFASLASLSNVFSQILKGKAQAVFLGTSGMGVLSQVLYFFNLSNIVAGLGLSEGVVRYTSEFSANEEKNKLESLHITIFSVLLFCSFLISILAIIFSSSISYLLFGSDENSRYVMLAVAAIPFAIVARFFTSILRGLREIKQVAKVSVYANFLSLPFAILLTYLYQINGAICGLILLQASTLVTGYIFVLKANFFNFKKFSLKRIDLSFLSLNKWYSLTSLVMIVMSNLTLIYVSRLIITDLGIDQNGVYAVTVKVSSVYFGMLFGAASTYYYPTLCQLESPEEISDEINNTLHYYTVILTPIIIGLITFSQPLVTLLFSSKFITSGYLLAYHLPGDMLRIAYETMGLTLLAKGKLKIYVFLYAAWCLLYISIAKIFGSHYGLYGFSCAYTSSFLIVMFMCYFCILKIFSYHPNRKTLLFFSLSILFIVIASISSIFVNSNFKYLSGSVALLLWIAIVFRDPAFKKGFDRILKKFESK